MSNDDTFDPAGSVGEEVAKLLSALQGWARESGTDYAGAAAAAASGASSSLSSLNEHIATGGKDCRYCPLCQVISAVRETSPEVKQHLTSAATSLLHAAAGVLATQVQDQHRRHKDSGVENIDLSGGDDWEDE